MSKVSVAAYLTSVEVLLCEVCAFLVVAMSPIDRCLPQIGSVELCLFCFDLRSLICSYHVRVWVWVRGWGCVVGGTTCSIAILCPLTCAVIITTLHNKLLDINAICVIVL